MIYIYSIGYEKRSVNEFISLLKHYRIKRLIDIRRLTNSRKVGFSKQLLTSMLNKINVEYRHELEFAPSLSLLNRYKEGNLENFSDYEREFLEEIKKIPNIISELRGELKNGDCFLCYEKSARYCHRRLVMNLINHDFSFSIVHI